MIARGAKFLGGYAASVRVTLTGADTGETLAQGMTAGTTGDTQRIMSGGKDSDGKRARTWPGERPAIAPARLP